MSNKTGKVVTINLIDYMTSAPFICGYKDCKAKRSFPKIYETAMAKPLRLNSELTLRDGQIAYENGRLFAGEFKGKLFINSKLTNNAIIEFIKYLDAERKTNVCKI